MNKKCLVVVLLLVAVGVSAQSLEEQFRAFQQAAQQKYTDFRGEANKKYADFLRGAWQYYQQSPAISQPKEEPVPPVIYQEEQQSQPVEQDQLKQESKPIEQQKQEQSVVQEQPIPQENQEQEQEQSQLAENGKEIPVVIVPQPEVEPAPQPIAPVEEQEDKGEQKTIEFYGTPISVRVPEQLVRLTGTSGSELAEAWEQLSASGYDNLLYDCLQARDKHHLCDWAYIEMLGMLAEQLYGKTDEAVLMQAYLYIQSGYAARFATDGAGKLYLLIGSTYQIYDKKYFELDGIYYYPLQAVEGGLHISDAAFDQEKPMTLQISPEQNLTEQPHTVSRASADISTESTINLNQIAFYNNYPTGQVGGDCGTRWAAYANAPLEESVRRSLYPTLMQAIRDIPEDQAVNKLLNWVQTAFEYEYDDKVWGQDRAFFPSETLHYPYADCEDRSILFSRIVRDLMKLDVVLLYYPGHLATAVALNEEIKGDYILLNGTRYTICDPTYIGAPMGKTMPNMNNQTAKVIKLER